MRRLDSLTALRWFAAVAVFARHALPWDGVLGRVAPQGATAVSFFFLLSGFVLAWSWRDGDTWRGFWRRRLARIYPAYFVAVMIGLAVAAFVRPWPTDSWPWVLGLVQSWSPTASTYYAVSPPLWSLSCEAFFYMAFPAVIRPLVRLDSRKRVLLGGSLLAIVWAVPLAGSFWLTYIFPATRFAEFLLGSLIACAVRDGWRTRIGLGMACAFAGTSYLAAGWVPEPFMWAAVTVAPFALLVAVAAITDLEDRRSWLRTPWLVTLGAWSFAFYLLHINILVFRPDMPGSPNVKIGACLLLSVAAAALLHYTVELPLEARLRGAGRARLGTPESASDS